MEPKYCKVCNLLLNFQNAAIKRDNGKERLSDKCKVCLVKMFKEFKIKKMIKKQSLYQKIKYKFKRLVEKVGESLTRLEK